MGKGRRLRGTNGIGLGNRPRKDREGEKTTREEIFTFEVRGTDRRGNWTYPRLGSVPPRYAIEGEKEASAETAARKILATSAGKYFQLPLGLCQIAMSSILLSIYSSRLVFVKVNYQ